MNIWLTILFTGIVATITILFFLVRISKSDRRYYPLVIYVVLILIELIVAGAIEVDFKKFPHLLYITEPFSMLYALLIYLYARNQFRWKLYLRKGDWLFLIPFFLAILSYLPYFGLSAQDKVVDFNDFGDVHLDIVDNIWEWNFEIILNLFFLILALTELKKHNIDIKGQYSNVGKIDLYLTQLIIKFALIGYIFEFVFVYLTYFGFPYYSILFDSVKCLNFVVVVVIGYDAFTSYKYIDDLNKSWEEPPVIEINLDGEVVKYAKSRLTEKSILEIKNNLINYMDVHKPYLQSKLRIKDLSDLTNVASHHISQVINECFEQNFYDFINFYRIEDAKKLLKDPKYKDYTYTAIGFEVGFNSKSAFYTAFKKNTGTTPGQF